MIKNMYHQQLMDCYMKKYNNYHSQNIYPSQYINILQNANNTGFIRLNIVNQQGQPPVSNYTITIYVTDGLQRDIPIMHVITSINPVRIELPMAADLGTQIVGPEYNFSTYNVRVDAFGYFANVVYNVRLFPNTTTDFNIEMVPISSMRRESVIEERVNIPPHPRDVIN